MRERPEMLLTLARSRDPKKRIVTCAQAAAALGMSLDRFDRDVRGAPGSGGEGVGLRPATMHAGRPSYDAGYLHQRFTQLGLWGWRAREDAAAEAAREEGAATKAAARAEREEAGRRRKTEAAARRAGLDPLVVCSGEAAAAAFAMLAAGADPAAIVVEARIHPAALDDLRRRRDAMVGAVTLSAGDLAALRAAGVRVDAADGAAAAASIVAATRCGRSTCRDRGMARPPNRATMCGECAADLAREYDERAARAREREERDVG